MKKAFSLIELLVVISIIGILVAAGLAVYSGAQKRGRDAKRRGDLQAIQNALEQYYAENSYNYPGGGPSAYPDDISIYISGGDIPVDPKSGDDYVANSYTTSAYTICTDLEIGGGTFCIYQLQ